MSFQKNLHTPKDPMCASIESSSLVADGFGTTFKGAYATLQVAGFHRAVPSTTLDKASMQFLFILPFFPGMSTFFSLFI